MKTAEERFEINRKENEIIAKNMAEIIEIDHLLQGNLMSVMLKMVDGQYVHNANPELMGELHLTLQRMLVDKRTMLVNQIDLIQLTQCERCRDKRTEGGGN